MAEASRPVPSWGDFVYDAFYTGAIGGSVVALFFLLLDAIEGRPLFTPSLMGSVLFAGVPAEEVTGVHLEMVPLYTAVHFGVFGALGLGVALAVRQVELHARNPFGVLLALFAVFEWAFFVGAALFLPGVMARLGPLRIAVANLLAAAAIALFLVAQHRPEVWQRLKTLRG